MKDFVLFGYLAYQIYNENILSSCVVEYFGNVVELVKKQATFSEFFMKHHRLSSVRR